MSDDHLDLDLDPAESAARADEFARAQAAETLLDMLPAESYEVLHSALSLRMVSASNRLGGGASLILFVPGKPAPQGSKEFKGFAKPAPGAPAGTRGKAILVESSAAVGPWRERIALAAADAMMRAGLPPLAKKFPAAVSVTFVMPRPSSTPKSYTPPAVKRPDLDKLERAVLDALTDVVWLDDSQVDDLHGRKVLAEDGQQPGVRIRVFSPGWSPDQVAAAQAKLAADRDAAIDRAHRLAAA